MLIDHGDGVVTAYAHQSRIAVSSGQSVVAGRRPSGTSAAPGTRPARTCTSRPASTARRSTPASTCPAAPADARGARRPARSTAAAGRRTLLERGRARAVRGAGGRARARRSRRGGRGRRSAVHLLGCRDCRLRVAELRDIAADLAAAEREERAEARVRHRGRPPDRGEPEPQPTGAGAVDHGSLAALGLGRRRGRCSGRWRSGTCTCGRRSPRRRLLVERQRDGAGRARRRACRSRSTPSAPASGLVVVDGDEVAFTFVGLPPLVGRRALRGVARRRRRRRGRPVLDRPARTTAGSPARWSSDGADRAGRHRGGRADAGPRRRRAGGRHRGPGCRRAPGADRRAASCAA